MTTRDEADPSELAEEAADLVVWVQHLATLAKRDYFDEQYEAAMVFEGIAFLMDQAWERINAVATHLRHAADTEDTSPAGEASPHEPQGAPKGISPVKGADDEVE